ncbi:hypothetical protein [Bradyrhizobium elkanii]|nr:hypothetical protein [Bradyrhizobium elkanii]MCW2228113.1 hypothetical protein [Bradyrhizobium elkanii]
MKMGKMSKNTKGPAMKKAAVVKPMAATRKVAPKSAPKMGPKA